MRTRSSGGRPYARLRTSRESHSSGGRYSRGQSSTRSSYSVRYEDRRVQVGPNDAEPQYPTPEQIAELVDAFNRIKSAWLAAVEAFNKSMAASKPVVPTDIDTTGWITGPYRAGENIRKGDLLAFE